MSASGYTVVRTNVSRNARPPVARNLSKAQVLDDDRFVSEFVLAVEIDKMKHWDRMNWWSIYLVLDSESGYINCSIQPEDFKCQVSGLRALRLTRIDWAVPATPTNGFEYPWIAQYCRMSVTKDRYRVRDFADLIYTKGFDSFGLSTFSSHRHWISHILDELYRARVIHCEHPDDLNAPLLWLCHSKDDEAPCPMEYGNFFPPGLVQELMESQRGAKHP